MKRGKTAMQVMSLTGYSSSLYMFSLLDTIRVMVFRGQIVSFPVGGSEIFMGFMWGFIGYTARISIFMCYLFPM
jgi:hypothetical protein